MSSVYKIFCVSHNPAIMVAQTGPDRFDWSRPEGPLAAIADHWGPLANHPHCDFLIGRCQGAYTEYICPGKRESDPRPNPCTHTEPATIAAEWIDLMAADLNDPGHSAATARALDHIHRSGCWTFERVHSIRAYFEPTEPGYVAYNAPCGQCKEGTQ